MTTIHGFVQVLFIFTLWNKSIFHALSYNLFSPKLLEKCFSPILYVITQVLQALRKSHHQELNRKTDALLLNTFSIEARKCKCCLYRFMYQRTENHTRKIHKNIISSFGLLPPQRRRALLEVNFFKTQIFTNVCFTVQWLHSNFHNTHKSKYQDDYIYHELRDIHLVSSSNRCLPWPKVCKALWVTSSYRRIALFLSQLFFFFLILLFLLVFFCIQKRWTDS